MCWNDTCKLSVLKLRVSFYFSSAKRLHCGIVTLQPKRNKWGNVLKLIEKEVHLPYQPTKKQDWWIYCRTYRTICIAPAPEAWASVALSIDLAHLLVCCLQNGSDIVVLSLLSVKSISNPIHSTHEGWIGEFANFPIFFVPFRCSILGRWQGTYERNTPIIISKEYASQQECTD